MQPRSTEVRIDSTWVELVVMLALTVFILTASELGACSFCTVPDVPLVRNAVELDLMPVLLVRDGEAVLNGSVVSLDELEVRLADQERQWRELRVSQKRELLLSIDRHATFRELRPLIATASQLGYSLWFAVSVPAGALVPAR